MTGRGVMWGTGVATVLGSLLGWLTNKLDGGWPWWAATGVVTVLAAGLSMWLTSPTGAEPVRVAAGGVYAGRDMSGRIWTRICGPQPVGSEPVAGVEVGAGGVAAGRDLGTDVSTDVDTGPSPWPPASGDGWGRR